MANSRTHSGINAQPLPQQSLIQNRYIVGPVAGAPTQFIIQYVGFDKQAQRKVVIRELFPSQIVSRGADGVMVQLTDPGRQQSFDSLQQQFQSQVRKYPVIAHPSIFSGVDVCAANNTIYQITDYAGSLGLKTFIAKKGGKLNEQDMLSLFLPVLEGLALVHEQGLVHAQIHPDNFRVEKENDGFSLILMNLGISTKNESSVSPGFTPPEVTSGAAQPGIPADIYGISATMYYALTGQVPPTVADRLQNAALPALRAVDPPLSEAVASAIIRGMAMTPATRIDTAAGLRQALLNEGTPASTGDDPFQDADESLFDGVELTETDAPPTTRSSKNVKLLIGLILGTILLTAVPLWFMVLGPMLSFQSMMEEGFMQMDQQGMQQMQQDMAPPEEMPMEENTANLTQRDREVLALLDQGANALAMGENDDAIAIIKQATTMAPNNPKVYLALGKAYVHAEQMENAIPAYEKVLRLDAASGEAYGMLGIIYYSTDRKMRAYEYFKHACSFADPQAIAFLQMEANKGNTEVQNLLQEKGLTW